MATYGDESIDSYLYSSYNPYSCRYLNPKPRAVGWRHKNYLADCGHAETYFDNHQRAQLKSILSQINPDLTPRLRKANTKDVGVQVNPKADASVQCSLGPRTLLARKREALRRRQENQPPGSPVGSTVRYPRTLGVYSPIASRRLFDFTDPDKEEDDPAPAPAAEPLNPGEKRGCGRREGYGAKSKARVRFQFLEQKYGYYHCRDCNLRWESAYVWCVQGTNKVYFKQFCRTCQKAFNPYRVEDITCQACKRALYLPGDSAARRPQTAPSAGPLRPLQGQAAFLRQHLQLQ
ncbi:hypothetical protein COCON_G00071270, partial [Conger conger]